MRGHRFTVLRAARTLDIGKRARCISNRMARQSALSQRIVSRAVVTSSRCAPAASLLIDVLVRTELCSMRGSAALVSTDASTGGAGVRA